MKLLKYHWLKLTEKIVYILSNVNIIKYLDVKQKFLWRLIFKKKLMVVLLFSPYYYNLGENLGFHKS